ncbi:MAG TPA: HD domain-containing phosphohydrolase [Thermotogota bacterium]|nr:HD domain-containing phosphohydrolase [Thermotogota bacterium]HPJ87833.1 HD domain-containing phosphohydrolase [Thermotogota bacterium]
MTRFVFIILSIFFLSVLVIIFLIQRENAIRQFEDNVEWISKAVEMSVKEPLWNLDKTVLEENFNSFLNIDSVKKLTVKENFGFLEIETGEMPPEDKVLIIERQINHNDKDLGIVTIYFTYEILDQEIYSNLFSAVIQVLFIFVALIIILNGISKMYLRPLENLGRIIRNFDLENPSTDLTDMNPDHVAEVDNVIKSFRKMSEEIAAGYEQLEASNKTLEELNNELNVKNKENELLTDKLNRIINLADKFKDSLQMSDQEFMINLFRNSLKIIDEADYGTVYLFTDKYVEFIDAEGHDLNLLKKSKIPNEYFIKNTRETIVRKNILNDARAYIKDERDLQVILDASRPIKETLFFELYIDERPYGGVCLDIDGESDKTYSKESIQAMNAFRNLTVAFYQVQRYGKFKSDFTKDLVVSITQMLEIHDKYTRGHSGNVADLTVRIAEELHLDKKTIDRAYWAGLVHDIGKILVSDIILNKAGKLTDEEYNLIKQHPVWGYQTLMNSNKLSDMAIYVLHHHERWDGKGYPHGISGITIPLISRIIAVADTWDAMTSDRSYRRPLDYDIALQEIKKNAGSQFDPHIVDAFLEIETSGELRIFYDKNEKREE